jgi:multimeric flavodoxin WrbA
MAGPKVRKGGKSVELDRAAFAERFGRRFFDPAYDALRAELDRVEEVAWDAYHRYRKAPRTRRAGDGFADPDQELSVEWLATRQAILEAARRQADPAGPTRLLLISASARTDQTCPGEVSKSSLMLELCRATLAGEPDVELDLLDLSDLTAEYGRVIYPCKACVSTAMPLCHWPCSCYPNHAIGQTGDWMAELYPRWVAAHGVLIVTPVYWFQAPATLKLMMDRLVCADGGNPDPTTTGGKDPARAKALELAGWPYPRHLAGRAFAVVVHGDAEGVDGLRRSLTDWLESMELVAVGPRGRLGRYLDYYGPYATSHDAYDRDAALHDEIRAAAASLLAGVRALRRGEPLAASAGPPSPRPK